MYNFTPAQKEAIEIFEKDVCVLAGAGSGKTTVLVQRFLHGVLNKGLAADQILAITFTEKAAAEMKVRIVHECIRLGLYELSHRLQDAYISTIHSFAMRLLRENPIEAGIDPFFRVMSEGESDILTQQVLDELLDRQAGDAVWMQLLSDWGEKQTRRAIVSFHQLIQSGLITLAELKPQDFAADRRRITAEILSLIRRISDFNPSAKPGVTETQIREGAPLIAGILKEKNLAWEHLTRNQALLRRFKSQGPLKAFSEEIKPLMGDWLALSREALHVPYKQAFLDTYERFQIAFDQKKKDLAAYDFEDLLVLACGLLESKDPAAQAIRSRYQETFRAILVDEYQDTSPLQARIIDALRSPGNLFIVGDVQQSIYGFRYAEPERFVAAASARQIPLVSNYRSRNAILDFVNTIFRQVFDERQFIPLTPSREFKSQPDPEIQIRTLNAGEFDSADQARIVEARSIAAEIGRLVASGHLIEEKSGHARPIRYGDIAILLRATSASRIYEAELAAAGIPYYQIRGRGFYDKQEIVDILSFLKLIEQPDDDIALAAALRSPLADVSDDALFWLARSVKNSSTRTPFSRALANLKGVPELSGPDRDRLERFTALLQRARSLKNTLSLSELIDCILRETDYEAKLLSMASGRQRMANLEKLVGIARSVETNLIGVSDFVSHVESLADRQTREPEARLEGADADSVLISTVHSAKGLEFACVIIADMGAKPALSNAPALLARPGFGLGMRLRGSGGSDPEPDYSYKRIAEEITRREKQEADRLLYVAMTRAKELLWLYGIVEDRKSASPSAHVWIQQVLALLPQGHRGCRMESIDGHRAGPPVRQKPIHKKTARLTPAQIRAAQERINSPAPAYSQALDFTVTDLWALSRPQEGDMDVETPVTHDDEALNPRNEFGTTFHRYMEFLARTRPKNAVNTPFMKRLQSGMPLTEQEEFERSVREFWKGPWGAALRSAKKVYPELPFIYKTRHGLLRGQMDLVFKDAGGDWVILDYKTNRLDKKTVKEVASKYEFQVALYAWVFRELYAETPKKSVLYFTTANQAYEFQYDSSTWDAVSRQASEAAEAFVRDNIR